MCGCCQVMPDCVIQWLIVSDSDWFYETLTDFFIKYLIVSDSSLLEGTED